MTTLTSSTRSRRLVMGGLLLALALSSTACSWSNKSKGTVIGTAAGGAAGAAVGSKTGSTARGAIIGAVVGGATGMIIGSQMDKQAAELEQEVAGATVQRVGEGLVVTFDSGLLYDFDSSAIRSDAARNLQALAASLKDYPNTDVLIVGHTDSQGSDAYNQDLSLRRADAASAYLATQGVASSRIDTSGRGELEPVETNDTDAGRQLNRRIEVAVFANEAARAGR
ncbi:MAG: OmpA family protein [Longimicrobiales bacterium]